MHLVHDAIVTVKLADFVLAQPLWVPRRQATGCWLLDRGFAPWPRDPVTLDDSDGGANANRERGFSRSASTRKLPQLSLCVRFLGLFGGL